MTAEPTADESERLAEPALPELPALGRKMSFTSAAMVNGAFPPAMSMCEPIINVVMRFEGGTAPALADVVEQAQSLLVFERLRTVPKRVGGSYSFVAPETPARVEDHVRSVEAGVDVWAVVDAPATAPPRDGVTEPPRPLWEIVRVEQVAPADGAPAAPVDAAAAARAGAERRRDGRRFAAPAAPPPRRPRPRSRTSRRP